jgi:hypothetical protein
LGNDVINRMRPEVALPTDVVVYVAVPGSLIERVEYEFRERKVINLLVKLSLSSGGVISPYQRHS